MPTGNVGSNQGSSEQSSRLGDTATTEQTDIASYMKPDMVRVAKSPVSGDSMPKTQGISTPGSPGA